MSLNPNTRTVTVEVLLNEGEAAGLDAIRGGLGRSPFFRNLFHAAAKAALVTRTHGTAQPPSRESRGCPGPGRPAGRARAINNGRRHL